ncbi:hypothetical protein [Archaeoglobus sp.]
MKLDEKAIKRIIREREMYTYQTDSRNGEYHTTESKPDLQAIQDTGEISKLKRLERPEEGYPDNEIKANKRSI